MKNICFILIFLSSISYFGQEKLPYIDYETVVKSVNEHAEKKEYDEVIKQLNLIHRNDSTYCSVLTSKSYYYILQEKYDDAIVVINEGLDLGCESSDKLFLLMNKGVCYSSKEEYQEALKVYETALKLFPKNAKLWYNKGIALEKLEDAEAAIEAFQKAILYNPIYRNAHVQLGNICYRQGLLTQALMCYNMALIIEPDSERAFALLKYVNDIVSNKNDSEAIPNLKVSSDDQVFENIDLILNNRVALNSNYSIENKISIPLVKQNHAMLQQLQTVSGNGGFWSKYYLPFYNWINANKYFDDFTYTVNYSIKNEEYKKIVEKNTEPVKSFISEFVTEWYRIISKNDVDGINYDYSKGTLSAEGKKKDDISIENWTFYDTNGRIISKGYYNSKGERDKEWTWYHDNGEIKEIALYEDGKLNGKNKLYFDDGKPYIMTTSKNDQYDGDYKFYLETGALKQNKQYKDGKLHGTYLAYFDVGEPVVEYETEYSDGILSKDLIEYYSDGKVFSVINFKDDNRHGKEIQYYLNGNKSLEANYKDGNLQGEYLTFYINGNPKDVGQSDDNYYNGPWKSYFYDGTLNASYSYNNGELDNLYKSYDIDGVLTSEFQYRKGEIISYKFFDKSGEVLSEERKKGGEFFYKGFHPNGNKASEGTYDVDGGKVGIWKFYDINGVLTDEGEYEQNEPINTHKSYYISGKTSSILEYDQENQRSYYQSLFPNGQMQSQGWFKNNAKHGEWRYYYIDGTIDAITFYHKDQLHGIISNYKVDGNPESHTTYKYGRALNESYYNTKQKIYETFNFKDAETDYKVVSHFENGNKQIEAVYRNGILHGPYKSYNYYGKIVDSGNYLNGNKIGEWKKFYEDGTIEIEETYVNGNLDGIYKRYFKSGQLEDQYTYANGAVTGTCFSYHENGNLHTSTEYNNNQLDGRKEFYSHSGKLQIVRFYKNNVLVGYTYYDTQGKEKQMIPIKNESGTLNAFYDNGKPSRSMTYLNGQLHDDYKAYYYDGQLENHTVYNYGSINGLDIEYFEDGQVKSKENWLLDTRTGKSEKFYANGKLQESIIYLNDQKHGEALFYNNDGKLIKTEYYSNGDIYDSKF